MGARGRWCPALPKLDVAGSSPSPLSGSRRPPLGGRRFWCLDVTLWRVECDSDRAHTWNRLILLDLGRKHEEHFRPGSCDLWLGRSPGAKPARVSSARWCMTRSTLFSRLGTLVLAGATITCSSNEPNPPAEAAVLAMAGGNSQSAPAGQALANPIGVRVTDDNGDPVADVTVEWSEGDGGSVSASSVSTDDDGRASVTWTLGPAAGSQTATAAVDGLDGSPVQFTATAVETGEITLTVTQAAGSALATEVFAPDSQPAVRLLEATGRRSRARS